MFEIQHQLEYIVSKYFATLLTIKNSFNSNTRRYSPITISLHQEPVSNISYSFVSNISCHLPFINNRHYISNRCDNIFLYFSIDGILFTHVSFTIIPFVIHCVCRCTHYSFSIQIHCRCIITLIVP